MGKPLCDRLVGGKRVLNKNNSKKDQRSFNFFFLYFIYISLYGIVVKFTAGNPTLFQIKTYIPEALLMLSVLPQASKKHRIDEKSFVLVVYMLLIMILNYILHGATAQSFYWWRDLIIPVFVAVFIKTIHISEEEANCFLRKLSVYGKIYILAGFTLALIENRMGWEWTSSFYAGHTFYGTDPYTRVLVNHYLGFVRTPGLSANFTSFAFYTSICVFAILWQNKRNNVKTVQTLPWLILGFATCILSTNKSAVLGLIIVLMIAKANDVRGRNKAIANALLGFSGMLLIISFFAFDSSTFTSTYLSGSLLRFDAWANIIQSTNFTEAIVPYNMFLYGSGTDATAVSFGISFFDNFYLYLLMTQGIVGLYLIVSMVIRNVKKLKDADSNLFRMSIYIALFGAIIGLTSNMIQGRAYFAFAFILLSFFAATTRDVKQAAGECK